MSTDNQWLNVQEISDLLQIKEETVRRWIRRQELPVLELGGPRAGYRIRREDLDHFIWQRYRMRRQNEHDRTFRNDFQNSDERTRALESVSVRSHVDGTQAQVASPSGDHDYQYISLLSRIPGITYLTTIPDQPGTIERHIAFVSDEFEQLLGPRSRRLRDDPGAWSDLIHAGDIERVRTTIHESARERVRFSVEYRVACRENDYCWVRDEAVPSDDQNHWQGVILNVSDRKKIEENLHARISQHAVIAELGEHAMQEIELDDLMEEAVRFVHSTLSVDLTKVLELQPGGEDLLLRAGVGWKRGMVNRVKVSAGAESQAGYTLLSNEPVIVTDLDEERRFTGPPLLKDNGVRSGISVIIAGHGKPWGVFGAHTRSVREFTRDDVHFLQAVANVLAGAIRMRGGKRQHGRWLSIHDVAGSLQVKDETVRRWIRRGELPIIDLGSSRAGYRIHPSDLDQFIQERYMSQGNAEVAG